jgi:hypothetical protein
MSLTGTGLMMDAAKIGLRGPLAPDTNKRQVADLRGIDKLC